MFRRFADNIRKQNWFSVFTDLLVVIVGILIAVAIDAWWAGYLENAAEQEYLFALIDDVNNVNQEAQRIHEAHSLERDKVAAIREGLRDGNSYPDSVLYQTWPVVFVFRERLKTYNELETTRRTLVISDAQVLRSLARLNEQIEFARVGQNWALDFISAHRIVILEAEQMPNAGKMDVILGNFIDAIQRLQTSSEDIVIAANEADSLLRVNVIR